MCVSKVMLIIHLVLIIMYVIICIQHLPGFTNFFCEYRKFALRIRFYVVQQS